MTRLSMDRIRSAAALIARVFRNTPQYECEPLSIALESRMTLKIETLNPVGCFKGRASEVVMERLASEGRNSAVCASAGNLGQALAYSGRARGVTVTVVASANADSWKLARTEALGADIRLVKGDFEMAREVARQISESESRCLIEDSENIDTCEAAATIGLEMIESSVDPDIVLIALGGGAMATGVGHVFKLLKPEVEIICVQPAGAPAMTLSWHARTIVNSPTTNTIADGVASRSPIPDVLHDLLEVADDALLVKEQSIIDGMRLLNEKAGLMVEPSAALGVAAVLENCGRFTDRHVATIICGSNISANEFFTTVGYGLRKYVP